MNKVSIIMPSYNAAKFIAASIQSVIGQTYRNWELLITDDCSKDDTVKIVEQFLEKDNRIKLFSTGKNSGPACARNKSLENATGKYIGNQLGFVLDNKLIYVAVVNSQIDNGMTAIVSKDYSDNEIKHIEKRLKKKNNWP